MVSIPGYVTVLTGSGDCTLDPRRVSLIRKMGETIDKGTGRPLTHYRYTYDYGDRGGLEYDVFVPADREYDFADEVAAALAERSIPGWVDELRATRTTACA